jgi:hypothetical protein
MLIREWLRFDVVDVVAARRLIICPWFFCTMRRSMVAVDVVGLGLGSILWRLLYLRN